MAGHSPWKNIQHRKGAQDAKKGKVFTKLLKEVTIAVKKGGGPNPEFNPRLRLALQNARGANVPKDNIERAIKRASGEGEAELLEVVFEAYGPEGSGIYIECTTDNNTRTVSNVRSYLNKFGGNLGKENCLQFVFERKGIITVVQGKLDEETFQLDMIDAGAEDVVLEDGVFTVSTTPESFLDVQKKLGELNIEAQEAAIQMIPMTTKKLTEEAFAKFMKLIDAIEDDDDVQKVYHNVEFDEAFAAKYA